MNLEPTVQVALVTGVSGLIAAVGETLRRQNKALGEVREHAETTRTHIENSHPTNLRDDVDQVLTRLDQVLDGQTRHDEALRQHGQDINGLRQDLSHERAERLAVAERLDHLYRTPGQ